MSKYIIDKNNDILNNKYVLFGIDIHKGLTYNNHYYILIKDNNTNYWIKFDVASKNIVKDNDEKIFFGGYENNDNSENSANAYILFYKKN